MHALPEIDVIMLDSSDPLDCPTLDAVNLFEVLCDVSFTPPISPQATIATFTLAQCCDYYLSSAMFFLHPHAQTQLLKLILLTRNLGLSTGPHF